MAVMLGGLIVGGGVAFLSGHYQDGMWSNNALAEAVPEDSPALLTNPRFDRLQVTRYSDDSLAFVINTDCVKDSCSFAQSLVSGNVRPTEHRFLIKNIEGKELRIFASGDYVNEATFAKAVTDYTARIHSLLEEPPYE